MKVIRTGYVQSDENVTAKFMSQEKTNIKSNSGRTLKLDSVADNTRYVCACVK
jgi:hypothetical protein